MYQQIEYKTLSDFVNFVNANKVRDLGRGQEGVAYLMRNGRVIKCLNSEYYLDSKRQEHLLTENDITLDSFLFPQNLYFYNGKVIGYDARYFANDLFSKHGIVDEKLVDQVLKARAKMVEDIKVLTEMHYKIRDIPGNLLFDTNRFGCIDTINFKYDEKITLFENIITLDYGILCQLHKFDNTIDYNIGEQVIKCLKRNNRI